MKKVLGLPAFRRLLAVSMIDQLATSSGVVALAVLVYRGTGSAIGATAFFLCAEFGPAFLSPPLVARLDREPPRRVISVLYTAEAVVFVVLALLVHRFALAPVLVLVLLGGSIAVTAGVLVRTTWTSITSGPGLVRDASGLINGGLSVCIMVGPAVGGALVALGGTVTALLVNAGAYGVSGLVMASARGLPRPSGGVPSAGRLRSALRYAGRDTLIRRLLGLQALALVFFAVSIPVEVVFAQRTLHTGAGGYGALLTAWGAGAIAGSGVYVRWRRLSSRILITLGTALLGAGFLLMAVAPSLSVALIGGLVAGVGNGIQVVSMRTALQEAVSERWMALVLSLNQSIFQAVPGAGIAIGGLIAASAGPRAALAVGAIGSLGMALAMWFRLSTSDPAPIVQPVSVEQEDSGPALTAATRKN